MFCWQFHHQHTMKFRFKLNKYTDFVALTHANWCKRFGALLNRIPTNIGFSLIECTNKKNHFGHKPHFVYKCVGVSVVALRQNHRLRITGVWYLLTSGIRSYMWFCGFCGFCGLKSVTFQYISLIYCEYYSLVAFILFSPFLLYIPVTASLFTCYQLLHFNVAPFLRIELRFCVLELPQYNWIHFGVGKPIVQYITKDNK